MSKVTTLPFEQAAECDFVRFALADIHGISRARWIPRRAVAKCLQEGIPTIVGILALGPNSELPTHIPALSKGGNATAVPMPETFHLLPWATAGKYKIGEVLCETRWSKDVPQEACPRFMARKQLERVTSLGLQLVSGWELEFYLLHQHTKKPLFEGRSAMSTLLVSQHEELYLKLHGFLEKTGVAVDAFQNKKSPGQMEYVTSPVSGIAGVDMAFNCKQATKEIAAQNDLQAVFMTNPFHTEGSNGLHYNFSFVDDKGNNVFSHPESEDKLSDFAYHFLAGLLSHAPALTTLCCPTTSCYHRLKKAVKGGKAVWGIDNRNAFIRVKFGSSGAYMENRLVGGSANPYLVVAATLAAGLDGVYKKTKCAPEMQDQVDTKTVLPRNLEEALKALEDDTVMREALGGEFIEWFVTGKRKHELQRLQQCPTEAQVREEEQEMYSQFF